MASTGYLGATFDAFRARHTMDNAQLAEWLGCDVVSLGGLRNEVRPDPASARFDSQVERLARSSRCRPDRLRALLGAESSSDRGKGVLCSQCGANITEDANFCLKCGQAVRQNANVAGQTREAGAVRYYGPEPSTEGSMNAYSDGRQWKAVFGWVAFLFVFPLVYTALFSSTSRPPWMAAIDWFIIIAWVVSAIVSHFFSRPRLREMSLPMKVYSLSFSYIGLIGACVIGIAIIALIYIVMLSISGGGKTVSLNPGEVLTIELN
jgi:hypothetical protein